MSDQELMALAAQLRCPEGAAGTDVARMMQESNRDMTHHSISRLGLQRDESILELGHGNASHLDHLMQKAEGLTYHGLDISELMQGEAEHLNSHFVADGRAAFTLYDGIHVPFSDHYFDKAFTVNTIYFWSDPLALLRELYRVLKPGGLFTITYAQKDFMQALPFTRYGFELYDDKKLEDLVAHSEFRIAGKEAQTETVKSKDGQSVERIYTTAVLKK